MDGYLRLHASVIFDGEQGLNDGEATIYCEVKSVTKRTAAPQQHTRIVGPEDSGLERLRTQDRRSDV